MSAVTPSNNDQYFIISSPVAVSTLVQLVNIAIREGAVPLGAPFFNNGYLYQAMVRPELAEAETKGNK